MITNRPESLHKFAGLAGAVLALVATAGCYSPPAPEAPGEGASPFAGPPIELRSAGTEHVVVFQAPSPGYEGTLDYVGKGPRAQQVFITIRRPDPAFVYSTQIVEQNIGTGIASGVLVEVFAREVEHGFKGDLEGYAPVRPAASAATPAPEVSDSPAK